MYDKNFGGAISVRRNECCAGVQGNKILCVRVHYNNRTSATDTVYIIIYAHVYVHYIILVGNKNTKKKKKRIKK